MLIKFWLDPAALAENVSVRFLVKKGKIIKIRRCERKAPRGGFLLDVIGRLK